MADWRGFDISHYPAFGVDGAIRVVFLPRGLQAERGSGGASRLAPSPAEVLVAKDGTVLSFRGPSPNLPDLDRRDFEEKTLDYLQVAQV